MANAKKKKKDQEHPDNVEPVSEVSVLDLNLDQVPDQASADPGMAQVTILKGLLEYSKSSGNPMFTVTLKPLDAGEEVFPVKTWCVLPNSNTEESTNIIHRRKLKNFCESFNIDMNEFAALVNQAIISLVAEEDTSAHFDVLKGYEGNIIIEHDTYQGEIRAKVARFLV